jgi:DNA repair exonuclease SbcCD nuclease subunit
MTVSFIHTADWQLGRVFGQAGEDARVELRRQRFATVARLGALAAERRVDAVLVAGDVFDTAVPGKDTMRDALQAMESFAGPWVLLPGNHDPAQAEGAWSQLSRRGAPPSIIVAAEPQPIVLANGRLVVLPAPLRSKRESSDLTEWFDDARSPPSAIRVGLAHGSIPSRLPREEDVHNPIAVDRAARARLDYLALGDWHGTVCIDDRTWYAGTPEPDRAKDNDSGNVLLVEIERAGGEPQVERVPVGRYRWHKVAFSVHGSVDVAALHEQLRRLGEPLKQQVVLLTVQGTITLACRADLDSMLDDLEGRFCDLRLDDAGLIAEASEDDLQAIGRGGFIGRAVNRLLDLTKGADPEQAATARLALQVLYLESVRGGA